MNNNKNNNGNKKRLNISVIITQEEYDLIRQKASDSNLSVSRYVVDCALNAEKRYDREAFDCAKHLVAVSRMIDELQDKVLKNECKKECGHIWQRLKY